MANTNIPYVSDSNLQAVIAKIKTDFALKTENTLTAITVNGTAVELVNKVAALTVPTKVSDLDNDSNFAENVIEQVKVNGTALAPANKAVNVVVPTTVAELTDAANYALKSALGTAAAKDFEDTVANDAKLPTGAAVKSFVEGKGYQTSAQVESAITAKNYTTLAAVQALDYATKTEVTSSIATEIGKLTKLDFKIVTQLPAVADAVAGTFYLISNGGVGSNKYAEYMLIDGALEKVGDLELDLSGYIQAQDASGNAISNGVLVPLTTSQINAYFA